jgi:predicted enzyme related to lactoylglutathione lyase
MNSVVHFEMPYDDRERMAKFYENVFGWQTQMLGEEMDNYVLATTTQTDESGPKRSMAAFFRGSPIGRRNTLPSSSQSMTFTLR